MTLLAAARLLPLAAIAAASAEGDAAADRRIAETLGGINGFLWGAATAAYQVEGSWNVDGRQPSIWDDFAHTSGKVTNNDTGDQATDFYRRYESDIQRAKDYGFNAFRYSLSWVRIYPLGEDGKHHVNPKGIEFYMNVTRCILDKGLVPMATMFHWDLPNDLSWLNESVVTAFVEYADVVWENFHDLVPHWATFNEPWTFCFLGYNVGVHAPGVKSTYEEYVCSHYVLLAHAQAVQLWRRKYQSRHPSTTVGIVLNYDYAWPRDPSNPKDVKAVQCCADFGIGRFADPVYLTGDYPACMKERLGHHLPQFTDEQKAIVKGSFIGPFLLNTYSGRYAFWVENELTGFTTGFRDTHGFLIGPYGDSNWMTVVPSALRKLLEYVNTRYKPGSIMVTENGVDVPGENNMPLDWALNDTFRVDFYRGYLDEAAAAVRESGVPLQGYFAWSLEDNFEWADGYSRRFGITYVDYATQKRYPKASANWFTKVIALASTTQSARGTTWWWLWLFFFGLMAPFVGLCFAYALVPGPARTCNTPLVRPGQTVDTPNAEGSEEHF